MIITLPGERPISWNKLYAGTHWAKRKKAADEAHSLVHANIGAWVKTFSVPVEITVTAWFKHRPLDADNICAKLYIDGLIGTVIHDDKPEFVRSVTTVSHIDKDRPRVEIEIRKAPAN